MALHLILSFQRDEKGPATPWNGLGYQGVQDVAALIPPLPNPSPSRERGYGPEDSDQRDGKSQSFGPFFRESAGDQRGAHADPKASRGQRYTPSPAKRMSQKSFRTSRVESRCPVSVDSAYLFPPFSSGGASRAES